MKNIVIEYQAKLFPFARAFFGFCLAGLLLVSCASGQRMAGNFWNANIDSGRLNHFGVSTIDGQNVLQYWFEDQNAKQFGYQIPLGQRNVEASTGWSNGFEDSTQLTLDVKEGRKYAVYAYELREGQDPNAPVVLLREYQESTGGKILKDIGKDALGFAGYTATLVVGPYIVIYGSPIWVPYLAYTHYQRKKKLKEDVSGLQGAGVDVEPQPADNIAEAETLPPDNLESQPAEPPPAPTARPFNGCCYVWIEDADTREVVAGTRLPGAGK